MRGRKEVVVFHSILGLRQGVTTVRGATARSGTHRYTRLILDDGEVFDDMTAAADRVGRIGLRWRARSQSSRGGKSSRRFGVRGLFKRRSVRRTARGDATWGEGRNSVARAPSHSRPGLDCLARDRAGSSAFCREGSDPKPGHDSMLWRRASAVRAPASNTTTTCVTATCSPSQGGRLSVRRQQRSCWNVCLRFSRVAEGRAVHHPPPSRCPRVSPGRDSSSWPKTMRTCG